mmetsp:Transcript_11070/g.29295  ORF Transcript_11070/g.29295 Transcript_11070/m.29295 type:complete len:123 (-) Transcript_11070:2392-2760(-)
MMSTAACRWQHADFGSTCKFRARSQIMKPMVCKGVALKLPAEEVRRLEFEPWLDVDRLLDVDLVRRSRRPHFGDGSLGGSLSGRGSTLVCVWLSRVTTTVSRSEAVWPANVECDNVKLTRLS